MSYDPMKMTWDARVLLWEMCKTGVLHRIWRPGRLSIIANDIAFSVAGDSESELRWDEAIGVLVAYGLIQALPAREGLQRYHVTYKGHQESAGPLSMPVAKL